MAGAFAGPSTTGLWITTQTTTSYVNGSMDVNFILTDTNGAMGYLDFNIYMTAMNGDTNYRVGSDTNILDNTTANSPGCTGTIGTQFLCGYTFSPKTTVPDGNYWVSISTATLGMDVNRISSSAVVFVDSNAPTFRIVDNNSTATWRTADFNIVVGDANFWISDMNTEETASYYQLNYGTHIRFSQIGSLATADYNLYIPITSDGNYIVSITLKDKAGNTTTRDINYALLDKTTPVVSAGITTGFTGADWDNFYGYDTNIRIRITTTENSTLNGTGQQSGIRYLDVNVFDINGLMPAGDANWIRATFIDQNTFDVNITSGWDHNFLPVTLKYRVTDYAGNVTSSLDMNTPAIIYSMTNPPGTSATNTTNFQSIRNFADIDDLTFQDAQNRGKIQFRNQSIDLSTYTNALKLMNLQTIFTMGNDALSNKYIDLNTSTFADINKTATVTIFNLPFRSVPGILMNDTNCSSSNCLGDLNYNVDTGRMDFNVLHFTKYTTDGNGPGFYLAVTPGYTTATITVSSLSESSTCRRSSTLTSYAEMDSAFQITGNGSFSELTGLSQNTAYTIYVQCRDLVGNDTNHGISFTTGLFSAGGSSSSGTGTGSTTPSVTTVESTSTDTYNPTSSEVTALLEGSGLSAAEIAEYAADAASGSLVLERKLVVEKIVSGIVTSYKSTFTITVKNSSSKDMLGLKVVETVPKSVAATAASLTSAFQFKILNEDPVLEFTLPDIAAGQTATVTYSVNKKVATSDFGGMVAPVAKFAEAPAGTVTPTCTSFTYSDWSACINGSQTRTVVSALPAGCINGNAVRTQSCTVEPGNAPATEPGTAAAQQTPASNTTTMVMAIIAVIVVIIIVGAAYLVKGKKKNKM